MGGRATGTFEAGVAARWIEARFRRMGLVPVDGSYLHEFPAEPLRIDADASSLVLRPSDGDGEARSFRPGDGFLPHPSAPPGSVEGELVFAGYGIESAEFEYDDLFGLDLTGKVVLLFRLEPQAEDRESRFLGRRMTAEASLARKVKRCQERGAVAVLAASPPGVLSTDECPGAPFWPAYSAFFERLVPMLQIQADSTELADTNFTPADAAEQLFCMLQSSSPLGARIPVAYVSRAFVNAAFAAVGADPLAWVRETDISGAGDGFETPLTVKIAILHEEARRPGYNVVGVLPGSDPQLREEYIVVGAHYDHVGRNEEGVIWNGADDNGSGTVAMLALAESFARARSAGQPGGAPRRSLAFVAFSGEEIGLLGSAWFLARDRIPVESTAAMVNLDMVGRALNGTVHVIGTKSAAILPKIVERSARDLELRYDFEGEEFFDRSDQVGFYYQRIPIVFFNTDEHEDYHRPSDVWDRIDYATASRITILARRVIQSLADLSKPPSFEDGYRRLQSSFGQSPRLTVPWPVPFEERLDF